MISKYNQLIEIESTKTTSMEDVSTEELEKNKEYYHVTDRSSFIMVENIHLHALVHFMSLV